MFVYLFIKNYFLIIIEFTYLMISIHLNNVLLAQTYYRFKIHIRICQGIKKNQLHILPTVVVMARKLF